MCNLEQALSYFRKTKSYINNFDQFQKNKNILFFEYHSNVKLLDILTSYQPNLREILKKYSELISVECITKSLHYDRYKNSKKGIECIIYQLENGHIKPISFVKLFLEKVDIKPSINILGLAELTTK